MYLCGVKADQENQIQFILTELRKGSERAIILQKFAKNYKSSTKTFDNRLKIAKERYSDEVKSIQERAKVLSEEAADKASLETLSVAERIDLLVKMAKGEIDIEQETTTKDGGIVTITVKPSHSDRRAAIAELNKMDGSYAPAETKTTITDTRPPAKVKLPDGTEIEI